MYFYLELWTLLFCVSFSSYLHPSEPANFMGCLSLLLRVSISSHLHPSQPSNSIGRLSLFLTSLSYFSFIIFSLITKNIYRNIFINFSYSTKNLIIKLRNILYNIHFIEKKKYAQNRNPRYFPYSYCCQRELPYLGITYGLMKKHSIW